LQKYVKTHLIFLKYVVVYVIAFVFLCNENEKWRNKVMKMKKLVSVLLVAACSVSLVACGGKKEEEKKAEEDKTLVMATNAEFPPYEYYEGEEVVGIDVDIAKAVAEELGMELKIEDMAFDSVIPAVSSGKADIALAGLTVTDERKENLNFTDTYAKATQVIIVKEDSAIAGPDDLEGKKIGVQLGTTGDLYASDIKDAEVEQYNKGFEAVQATMQGKIDAVIIDSEPAKEFVAEAEGLKILDEAFTEEEYAIGIAKDNDELLEKVNKALKSLKESGKLDEIVAEYIKADAE
jgi:hypothetical protein